METEFSSGASGWLSTGYTTEDISFHGIECKWLSYSARRDDAYWPPFI
jgi:hydrogenase maturation factor